MSRITRSILSGTTPQVDRYTICIFWGKISHGGAPAGATTARGTPKSRVLLLLAPILLVPEIGRRCLQTFRKPPSRIKLTTLR